MYCGPALGPLLSSFAVANDWHWVMWEIVFMAALLFLFLAFLLPETSGDYILLHRTQRLRRITQNKAIHAPSEVKKLNMLALLVDAMIKPTEIALKDPAIAFACVYGALIYSKYYSCFEVFPIVYIGSYGMTLSSMGLVFLSIIVGTLLFGSAYILYLCFVFGPQSINRPRTQGPRLITFLAAIWLLPVGLILFGWIARPHIHWIVPTIGIAMFAGSSFVVFQGIVVYMALSYPKYVASLFAADDFLRSMFAAGTIMFSPAMYGNLGIHKGVSLPAGLSVMGILGMYFLFFYGARLRAMSKFTES